MQQARRFLVFILVAGLFVGLLGFSAQAADARVRLTFHSFNGSVIAGRYPHTFVSLDGTLDSNGKPVHANFGYSTSAGERVVFGGTFTPEIMIEKEKYVNSTNRHFSVELSDQQYGRVLAVVEKWRTRPYNLNTSNCIHFVAAIANEVGLRADVPERLTRKPKAWLNYVGWLNPQLHAKPVN